MLGLWLNDIEPLEAISLTEESPALRAMMTFFRCPNGEL
jgi:hypothetical protein